MNNSDSRGHSLVELLQSALAKNPGPASEPRPCAEHAPLEPIAGSPLILGEVLDTHHPQLPGRVRVRFWESADRQRSEWIQQLRHLSLRRGDRVLVSLPLGAAEWLVAGALRRAASDPECEPSGVDATHDGPSVRLEPGQPLLVAAHDGTPLVRVSLGPEGVCLELARDQVELKARRLLRLSADTIEIEAGAGGVDVRSEGDAVTRARTIRLN